MPGSLLWCVRSVKRGTLPENAFGNINKHPKLSSQTIQGWGIAHQIPDRYRGTLASFIVATDTKQEGDLKHKFEVDLFAQLWKYSRQQHESGKKIQRNSPHTRLLFFFMFYKLHSANQSVGLPSFWLGYLWVLVKQAGEQSGRVLRSVNPSINSSIAPIHPAIPSILSSDPSHPKKHKGSWIYFF